MPATQLLEWRGEDVSVAQIAEALARLRASSDYGPLLRTSVMTHLVWAPSEWRAAASATLAGLEERHPSRTVMLLPEPDANVDRIDAEATVRGFELEGLERQVSTEVVSIRLLGERAFAPASVVQPLLRSDLPVFLRWRGEPDFGSEEWEQLTTVADRVVVDSGEWRNHRRAYPRLAELFEQRAVSDIAWRRTLPWRRRLAGEWPRLDGVRELRVVGPRAEALLLAGWLRSRLEREVLLVHEPAERLELVAADGGELVPPEEEQVTPSDLLSAELDTFGRDRIYEAAALAAR